MPERSPQFTRPSLTLTDALNQARDTILAQSKIEGKKKAISPKSLISAPSVVQLDGADVSDLSHPAGAAEMGWIKQADAQLKIGNKKSASLRSASDIVQHNDMDYEDLPYPAGAAEVVGWTKQVDSFETASNKKGKLSSNLSL